ncbi:helix-turn-helix domain-containing protein [Amycolatopsis sp. PS_44_ISF1]|uniref:PucR family transcriptional regulator n=1 Tax=Amycolatopsis sp. PS_44_ISF1 TaxID=2974917 RepID=UPI0028E0826B|nr:helix-turn-helix domain-containing protein [Amycolatopsis sp. PS_44_ISF1]MDT8912345.1 helix-turn-helix domain-containing protein [Amycolatopsis sp. PS_44_ISF1]
MDPAIELLPRAGEIAAAMIARCAAEITAYRLLPATVLEGDLVANATAVLELFLTTVAEDRRPTEDELALPIAWGAERARDGLPLEAVLKIYPLAAEVAWEQAAPIGDPVALGTRMLAFLGEVMPRVAEAYLREREDLDWEQREDRQNLAASLLADRPARRRELADRYDVVVFHLPVLPASSGNRASTDVFRAIRSDLDGQPGVLVTVKGDGGVLLVPATVPAGAVAARVDRVCGRHCVAAAARAETHADIPAAHAEAVEVLALAEDLRRPARLYRLADLAVEYQLARPGPAREALAAVLAPLEDHPHLIDALRAFVTSGYNRGEAATALNIHRNTLTYRLGRIQLITGFDATRPADARHLAATVTAYDTAHRNA